MSEEEKLDERDNNLTQKIKEFENNLAYSKNFGDYEWITIRKSCQIEYEELLNSLNKNSNITSILSKFELKTRNRTEKYIKKLNQEEFNNCLNLFIEFYQNDLKRKYLNLC